MSTNLKPSFSTVTLSGYSDSSFDERFNTANDFLTENPNVLVIMMYNDIGVTINNHTLKTARSQYEFRKVFIESRTQQGFFVKLLKLIKRKLGV